MFLIAQQNSIQSVVQYDDKWNRELQKLDDKAAKHLPSLERYALTPGTGSCLFYGK